MKIILDYNRTVFNPETNQLFSGVYELLKNLSKNHTLFLISMNEPGRRDRLETLGIKKFFSKTIFVNEKTEEVFMKLVGSSVDVVIAGDRVMDEIRIGNILGFVTVWVQQGKFGKEVPRIKQEKPTYTINKITDLGKILSQYE